MSKHTFKVSYDGDDLKGVMDVSELAPALIEFGNLFNKANELVNGNKSKINLYVSANFEEKCFEIEFQLVQSIYEHVKSIIVDENVSTAKDILEWLGILGISSSSVSGLSIFGYLKLKQKKQIKSVDTSDKPNTGNVTLNLNDNSSLTINGNVFMLGEDPSIQKSVSGILKPLEKEGRDRLSLGENTSTDGEAIEKEDAIKLINYCDEDNDDEIEEEGKPSVIEAYLKPHKPVFDGNAKTKWHFRYGKDVISVDISETSIAKDTLERGSASKDDIYKVELEIRQDITKAKNIVNRYKIVRVLEFKQASIQMSLLEQ